MSSKPTAQGVDSFNYKITQFSTSQESNQPSSPLESLLIKSILLKQWRLVCLRLPWMPTRKSLLSPHYWIRIRMIWLRWTWLLPKDLTQKGQLNTQVCWLLTFLRWALNFHSEAQMKSCLWDQTCPELWTLKTREEWTQQSTEGLIWVTACITRWQVLNKDGNMSHLKTKPVLIGKSQEAE